MVNVNKIFIAFILGAMSISICAHATEKKKPQRVVAKRMFEKRHASLVRGLWNNAKFYVGIGSFGFGVLIIPISFQAAFPLG